MEQTSAQKEQQKKEKRSIFRQMTDQRRLIQLYGDHTLIAHGCRRILLYTQEEIRLSRGKRTVLRVLGEDLCCTSFSAGAVTVQGHIRGVLFEDGTVSKREMDTFNRNGAGK